MRPVQFCLPSNKLNSSNLRFDLFILLVHPSCSERAIVSLLFHDVVKCTVSLATLIAFGDISSNLRSDSEFVVASANNAFVGAGGVFRFPPPYTVVGYIHRYSERLDAR